MWTCNALNWKSAEVTLQPIRAFAAARYRTHFMITGRVTRIRFNVSDAILGYWTNSKAFRKQDCRGDRVCGVAPISLRLPLANRICWKSYCFGSQQLDLQVSTCHRPKLIIKVQKIMIWVYSHRGIPLWLGTQLIWQTRPSCSKSD